MPTPILVFNRERRQGRIGTLVLDLTLGENHERKNRVTQWPIEDGSDISDHIGNEPKRLMLDGFVTDSPLVAGAQTQPRVDDAYRLLNQLWRDKQLLEVVTQFETYYEMAIERINVPRNPKSGEALRFTVELVQVLKVSSQMVDIPADAFPTRNPVPVENDPPNSIPDQATPQVDTGNQPTSPPEEEGSWLYEIIYGGANTVTPETSQVTPQEIPVNSDLPAQKFQTSMAGEPYEMKLAWNTREEAWGMGIATPAGDPIIEGVKVVPNYELLDQFADERLPKGYLVALDSTKRKDTIGRYDLGDTVPLVFVPREPIA